jgi:DnaJ-domain-containing protein 1
MSGQETVVSVLSELLRLYDWRFELAEREKDLRNGAPSDFRNETRRLLNQYGTEKKAAWEAARRVLGK